MKVEDELSQLQQEQNRLKQSNSNLSQKLKDLEIEYEQLSQAKVKITSERNDAIQVCINVKESVMRGRIYFMSRKKRFLSGLTNSNKKSVQSWHLYLSRHEPEKCLVCTCYLSLILLWLLVGQFVRIISNEVRNCSNLC